jgi:hypothetical protein
MDDFQMYSSYLTGKQQAMFQVIALGSQRNSGVPRQQCDWYHNYYHPMRSQRSIVRREPL